MGPSEEEAPPHKPLEEGRRESVLIIPQAALILFVSTSVSGERRLDLGEKTASGQVVVFGVAGGREGDESSRGRRKVLNRRSRGARQGGRANNLRSESDHLNLFTNKFLGFEDRRLLYTPFFNRQAWTNPVSQKFSRSRKVQTRHLDQQLAGHLG